MAKVNQEEHKVGLSLRPEGSEESRREARISHKEVRERQPRKEESVAPTSKPKSQLQIELEKHAARQQEQKPE